MKASIVSAAAMTLAPPSRSGPFWAPQRRELIRRSRQIPASKSAMIPAAPGETARRQGRVRAMRLTGKRALVTGASGEIGRAIVARLAREGARVAAAGRRPAKLEALAAALGK
ncbi:MAG: SDR family NAD(P)-dependent oxidoreductase, partial [Kiloniellales bacterium]|nr:SDR family NAD(P)-dependent oxidoreductase [Kiloniellales bacterium]